MTNTISTDTEINGDNFGNFQFPVYVTAPCTVKFTSDLIFNGKVSDINNQYCFIIQSNGVSFTGIKELDLSPNTADNSY